ncbi:PQQ-binding-like beta-propeller repeat protein [Candidatus Sumerlaeota bacterium]|nr:PQQ-binding-like beta-propeller repeat protein [Candidatus Sumerlaeota bacterium]
MPTLNQDEKQESRKIRNRQAVYYFARGVAMVAGVFTLAVCLILAADFARVRLSDPMNSPALERLIEESVKNPNDQELQQEIRELDLLARRAFFLSQRFRKIGAWLLAIGLTALLAALKIMRDLRLRLPDPTQWDEAPPVEETIKLTRWHVAAFGGILLLAVAALIIGSPEYVGEMLAETDRSPIMDAPTAAAPLKHPDRAAIMRNWPGFRGPLGNGVAVNSNAPATWSGETGENILWRVETPLPGFSSPVFWDGRLYLTGADADKREVYCIHGDTGELLWSREVTSVPGSPAQAPEVMEDTGYAAPTPAVDGFRVVAMFANGDVAAFDLDGKALWSRNLGLPENSYGYASSPVLHDGLVLIQYDNANDPRVMALNGDTGKTVWETKRPDAQPCWSSPVMAQVGGIPQFICSGSPYVTAYDPADGREYWRVEIEPGEIAPTPAFADGLIFVGHSNIYTAAIDPASAEGAEKIWAGDDLSALLDVASPLAANGRLYIANSGGVLTCANAETGEELWTHEEFSDGFYASPSLMGDRIYLTDMAGVTHVFRDADHWESIAENPLGEECFSSPALIGGRIYLRGKQRLFCIEGGAQNEQLMEEAKARATQQQAEQEQAVQQEATPDEPLF